MPEEVLFETETRQTRAEVAAYLRQVADKLDAGDPVTLAAGEQSTTLDVPTRPTFEVKVERETSTGGGEAELSIEFELEWPEGGGGDETLSVE